MSVGSFLKRWLPRARTLLRDLRRARKAPRPSAVSTPSLEPDAVGIVMAHQISQAGERTAVHRPQQDLRLR